MTRVYRLHNDVNRFQYFLTATTEGFTRMLFECRPRGDEWVPPEVYIFEPLLKRGCLLNFISNPPIFSPEAADIVMGHLQMAGEILPLPHQGEVFSVLNVLNCIKCLDQEKTEFNVDIRTGERYGGIQRYVFHPDRFSEASIFKIPETHRTEVLVVDHGDGESLVDTFIEFGIEGYRLTLLWEAENKD